jgi:hypothetical protein
MLSIDVSMPAARSPEKILEHILPACQIPILNANISIVGSQDCKLSDRSGDSCFVYQEDVINETAGRNGPSVTPTRNRHSIKLHGLFMAGMQIVTADQASIQHGSRTRGLPFAMMTLAGI